MITIKDVANKAGVSVTTVSRVMNNRGPLSEATKKAVHDAMEELGYLPNDVARALGKNSMNIIGLIIPGLKHPFFGEMVHEFEYYAHERDYKLMVFATEYDTEKEKRCINLMRRNMVDGIIYASHSVGGDFQKGIHIPAVIVENEFNGIPAILSDNVQGGTMAARHLIARGCRNLVHITGRRKQYVRPDSRTGAFLAECERSHVPCKVYYTTRDMFVQMEYSEVIGQVFGENPDMDGIFASSDIIGAQCMQAALSLGYRIPEQIKIVGYDDTCISHLTYPPMTTVRQNLKEIVRTAVDTLMDLIEGKEVEAVQKISVAFIERRTT